MEIHEYEKCVLSAIFRQASGVDRVPQRIVAELDEDKFDPRFPNRLIYQRIVELVLNKQVPNIPNVCRALGSELATVGGEPYLQSLLAYLPSLGVYGADGFETWVRVIDAAGRLRHLSLILDKYKAKFSDFERLIAETKDVDEFLSAFMLEINAGVRSTRSTYNHISIAASEELRRLEMERQGYVVDIVPTGWPNLERYFIPRPKTLGVISGLTSMGKTQLALQILLGAAIQLKESGRNGYVAINELETQGWRLNRRMACCLAGINSKDLAQGMLSEVDFHRYCETLDYISTLPIYFDDNPHVTSKQLEWQAVALHIEKGPRVLGVSDYAELFADTADSEELRVSNIVRSIRRISWDTGSCEIVISQLNNAVMMTASKIGGDSRTRYSGAIAQAADWFIECYNPVQMRAKNVDFVLPEGMSSDLAYLLVEKNKDYDLGQIPIEWSPHWTRFRDVSLELGQVYRRFNVREDY